MRVLGLILIIFFPLLIEAQSITISGKVKDRETGEMLEFASISLKDRSIGTLTNLLGEFDFHMPIENKNDILVISMIGYFNFEAPVWSLQNDPNQIIFLDKSVTLLKEVVVIDSLLGGDILRIALSHIDQNFPKEPFMMDCFYRDIKKVGGNYISLLEAAAKVFDEDYAEPRNQYKLRERVIA
jgi:carboxypeptidase-like protein